jgi:putative transposase
MEIGTRRLVHFHVIAHPNAAWTLQQFREAINDQEGCRFLVHDRDSIYSQELDLGVKAMGVKALKTLVELSAVLFRMVTHALTSIK